MESSLLFHSLHVSFSLVSSSFTTMVAASPTPSFPGAWPDLSSSDIAALPPLPDKVVLAVSHDTPQHVSPSLLCLSPRPLPELPSLSSSISTVESRVSSPPVLPDELPCSLPDAQITSIPQADHSPALLDLREPRSPDPAHFSPADDVSPPPSPSSSNLALSHSFPNNCPRAISAESIATYLPSPSSSPTTDAEPMARQADENHPDPYGEELAIPCSGTDVQEHVNHATKIPIGKRTFLNRVKRIGGRVRKLFKTRTVETKPRRNSVSSLVSSRRPSLSVSVRLPAAVPDSPASRQESEAPFHSITRRFSLHSLLHSRLPRESADASSRGTVGNRLSTVVSAASEGERLSLEDTRSPNAPAVIRNGMQSGGDQHEKTAEGQAVRST